MQEISPKSIATPLAPRNVQATVTCVMRAAESADFALVDAKHQRCLNDVRQGFHLKVTKRIALSSEKTRSAAAEFGVKANTIRAASAHTGNLARAQGRRTRRNSEKYAFTLEEISKK